MDNIRSDVHGDLTERSANQQLSIFEILPDYNLVSEDCTKSTRSLEIDEDGDLVLNRAKETQESIAIWHKCSTDLQHVGLQVWPGAMLLADYILANKDLFAGCVGLEVGAGTGFAGLVLARTARRVFLVDHDAGVLENCQRNVAANAHLFRQGPDVALVRHLDLFHAVPFNPERSDHTEHRVDNLDVRAGGGEEEAFQWLPEDVAELANVQVILAADMIYDDDLTEALIRCMEMFLKPGPSRPGLRRILLLATEKRYNLSYHDTTPQPHAYLFWRTLFSGTPNVSSPREGLQGRRLELADISQRFRYPRSKDLEMWELTWSPMLQS